MWFALITAVLALIRPVMHFRATTEQLAKYTQSPVRYSVERPAGCTGLLPPLWHAGAVARHPEHGYMRVVKNAVEEGSESFGYMLCRPHPLVITLPFPLTHDKNNLFTLRRETAREIVINNILRTLGLSCKKDIS